VPAVAFGAGIAEHAADRGDGQAFDGGSLKAAQGSKLPLQQFPEQLGPARVGTRSW
jgi:hypothetical protein